MVERISALEGHLVAGVSGIETENSPGVTLTRLDNLVLSQMATWPDCLEPAATVLLELTGVDRVPGFGCSVTVGSVAVLRIAPLICWVVGSELPAVDPSVGATLDLSHSRTRIRLSGPDSMSLLNRFLPLDLRESAFPVGSVASSTLHHVGVTLWRSVCGYELFIPRGFSLSCWEVLFDTARQFGVKVCQLSLPGASEDEDVLPD